MEKKLYIATGRRKRSVARVRIFAGGGKIKVNNNLIEEYFPRLAHQLLIKRPLEITKTLNKFDVLAKVEGGGISGQADAIRHGIARALVLADGSLMPVLRKEGLLTRDSRMKERKKYGQKGARKRFQWTKR